MSGGGLPQAKLDAALAALGEGDTGKAEALFAQVQAMEAAGIARAGASGLRAWQPGGEAEISWSGLRRGTTAWRRGSSRASQHLGQSAGASMALAGDYPAAVRLGEELIDGGDRRGRRRQQQSTPRR